MGEPVRINPIPGLELVRDILRDQNFVGGVATITMAIERIQELDSLRQQVQDLKAENERLRNEISALMDAWCNGGISMHTFLANLRELLEQTP